MDEYMTQSALEDASLHVNGAPPDSPVRPWSAWSTSTAW